MYKLITIILMVLLSITGFTQEINNAQKQFIKTSLISNGGFENGKTGWVTYKDTAQAMPVDGVGGSPTSTLATTTSSPLAGRASGLMSHGASNQQGEGSSYAFSIDSLMQTKVINISGSYTIVSGTYSGGTPTTDSDVVIYVYDVTNNVMIQPTAYKLDGAVVGKQYDFNVSFQASSNSTSYRLIFHYATTTTSAFTFKYEVTDVSKQSTVQGAIETDWVDSGILSSNSNWLGFGTLSGINIQYKRKGADLYMRGTFVAGSMANTAYQIPLPLNLKVSSNYISNTMYGTFSATVASGSQQFYLGSSATGNGYIEAYAWASAGAYSKVTSSAPMPSPSTFYFTAGPIPIQGWSSSQLLSSDSSSRVVAFSASTLTSASLTNGTAVSFSTKNFDTHGTFNLTSYTIPEAGYYRFNAGSYTTSSGGVVFRLFRNGSLIQTDANLFVVNTTGFGSGSRIFYCNSGDVITLVPDTTLTLGSTAYSHFSAEKVQGPSQIGAGETVAASYWMSANSSVSTSLPFNYDTKLFDTHGAVTTGSGWKFTAPIAGIYSVSACNSITTNTGSRYALYKNGSIYSILNYNMAQGECNGISTQLIKLLAGDYIDVRSTVAVTGLGSSITGTANTSTFISISRIGL